MYIHVHVHTHTHTHTHKWKGREEKQKQRQVLVKKGSWRRWLGGKLSRGELTALGNCPLCVCVCVCVSVLLLLLLLVLWPSTGGGGTGAGGGGGVAAACSSSSSSSSSSSMTKRPLSGAGLSPGRRRPIPPLSLGTCKHTHTWCIFPDICKHTHIQHITTSQHAHITASMHRLCVRPCV